MANWENQVLTAIIRGEDKGPELLKSARKQGISAAMFAQATHKILWDRIEAHYARIDNTGHTPSESRVDEWGIAFDYVKPSENFTDLCERLRAAHVKRRSSALVEEFMESLSEDSFTAVADLQTGLRGLTESIRHAGDKSLKEVGLEQLRSMMALAQNSDGLTGMPWPWPQMNQDTGGIHPGDYIMVWAIPKTGKTWFGLFVALFLYMRGKKVLIYSKEMTWDIILRRIGAILTKSSYSQLKSGTLPPSQVVSVLATMDKFLSKEHPGDLHFTQADRADGSVGGPAEIMEKIEEYQPDFVFLDSAYMLEMPAKNTNPLDWKSLSIVNRQIKQIAKTTGIPILALFQENETQGLKYKKTRGTASLAMNKGAVMDCDLGIRLIAHHKKEELSIHYSAAREINGAGFTINFKLCENIEFTSRKLHELGDDSEEEPASTGGEPTPTRNNESTEPRHRSFQDQFRNNEEPAEGGEESRESVHDETQQDLPEDEQE